MKDRVITRLRDLIAYLHEHADPATAAHASQAIQDAIEEISTLEQTVTDQSLELLTAYGQEMNPEAYAVPTPRMKLLTIHNDDTKWKTHCVDCGDLLIEYEKASGWEYSTVGAVVVSNPGVRNFGGWRCPACNEKLRRLVEGD